MFFDALDYWSLFHAFFGVIMAHMGTRLSTLLVWAWAWEWFEETDLEPFASSTFGLVGNVNPLNAVVDVALAVITFTITRWFEDWRRNQSIKES